MNLKINNNYIYILIFTCFFFLWGMNIGLFNNFFSIPFYKFIFLFGEYRQIDLKVIYKIKLSYIILFLLGPIFYGLIKKRNFLPKEIFNNQKYIIIFILFIFTHFFLVKIYYQEIISKSEIANLIYLFLLSVIYCHYRNFIFINFKKIILFYLIIFIGYSIYEDSQLYNLGQCNVDLPLIDMIRKHFQVNLTNSIFLENSHLGIMSVAVFFSSIYILVQDKKSNILFLLLLLIEVLVVLNNLSTTYFVCYFISQIVLLIFFFKKLNIKFWIFTILLLSINSYLFFSDKNCTVKVTDFKVKEILQQDLVKKDTNLTTLIYKRSAIIALNTLKNRSFGWGIDGMDDATNDLMSNYITNPFCEPGALEQAYKEAVKDGFVGDQEAYQDSLSLGDLGYAEKIAKSGVCNDPNSFDENGERKKYTSWSIQLLNTKDGLSNIFKMFTEFGIFTFIILFYFIKYIRNIQNINPYNLFIIVLFVTMCIRGVGYFNGGFIFCLLEFMYYKKFSNEFEFKKN